MKTKAELKKQNKDAPVPMGVFLVRNTKTHEFILGAGRLTADRDPFDGLGAGPGWT